jgi:hypothetical protein
MVAYSGEEKYLAIPFSVSSLKDEYDDRHDNHLIRLFYDDYHIRLVTDYLLVLCHDSFDAR